MLGKHAQLADAPGDRISAADGRSEESPQPLRRDHLFDRLRIDPGACERDRVLPDVAPEDLHAPLQFLLRQILHEQDGQRVHLLAGRAGRNPEPQRHLGLHVQEHRKDFLREGHRPRGIAKEPCHPDQDIAIQRFPFGGVLFELLPVRPEIADVPQQHAPLDPAFDRRSLVVEEIDPVALAQQLDDAVELGSG